MSTIITPSEEQINIVVNDEKISINVESGDVIVNVNEQIVEVSTVNGGYPLPTTVYSVFGRTGNIIATEGDYDLGELGDVTLVSSTNGDVLTYDGTKWINKAVTGTGTVTSVNMSVPVGLQVSGNPITVAGTLAVNFAAGYSLPTTAKQTTWDAAYNDSIVSASVSGTTTKTLTLNQQDGGTITASWTDIDTNLVTSVNGYVGTVVLTTSDIAEGSRLYYTETRVSNNTDVAANTAARHSAVTIGTANGLSLSSQVLSLALASASTTGALSSTDWNKFNDASGTVTSVGASVPTGMTISGSPIVSAGTLAFGLDTGYTIPLSTQLVPSGGSEGQLLAKNSATNYDTLWIDNYTEQLRDTVKAAVVINKGQAVYVSGANGTNQLVSLASNATEATSSKTLGLASQNFAINDIGQIITEGLLAGLDTSTAVAGDPVWLGVSGNLIYGLANKPVAPAHLVYIGVVTRAQLNNGEIYVKIQNGVELREVHDVLLISEANNQGLFYESATSLWKNKSIATVLGYTPISLASLSGVSPLSYNNTTGAFSIAQATTSANGYLSSTDWNTFNGKQAALNGTGFVKASGTTISYDNSTYYLASNPNAYIALTGLSATAPLSYNNTTGGFTISQAGVSGNGYLSSTDWNTFNNKQAAGNYITALSGEATASGPGSAVVTLSTSAVTGKLLTGVNITGGSISATDSILVAFGKVQNQINGVLGGAIYQSVWNASTNSPTLTSGTGTKGYYYIVSVAGSTNLDGITDWKIGDWAIFNGTTWNKVDNSDAVSSVNGFTGAVSLTTANISEVTNLYYTDVRVSANTDVAANTAARHAAVTLGTANGLSLSTQTLSLGLASTSATGALSSTDWNTFNLKQAGSTNLTSLAALTYASTSFVKMTASGTFALDTNTYLTGNQTITLSGDVSGSGTTAITTTIGALKVTNAMLAGSIDLTTKVTGLLPDGNISSAATWNAKQNALSGTGFVKISGTTISYDNSTYYLASNPSGYTTNVGTVTSVAALTIGTTGTDLSSSVANSTTTPVITLNVPTASATNRGALSSADWTTFNNKQSALTNPVTGTGTTNYLPKFTGTSTIGNSVIQEASSNIGIGVSPSYKLDVNGAAQFRDDIRFSTTNSSIGYTDAIRFVELGVSTRMTLSSGNLGLGVTPSAWYTGYTALQVGESAALFSNRTSADTRTTQLANNAYLNSGATNWIYAQTDEATRYGQVGGEHQWFNAPSGTAGNAITFTQAMTLTAAGRLLLGTTTESTYLLDVNGTGRFVGNVTGTSFIHYVNSSYNATSSIYGVSYNYGSSETSDGVTYSITGGSAATTGNFFTWKTQTGGGTPSTVFTIAKTGAATFSSSITATYGIFTGSGIRIESNSAGSGARFLFNYTSNASSRSWRLVNDYDAYGDFQIQQSTTQTGSTYSKILGFSATGAATFSSSVTATSFFESSDSRLKTLIHDNYQTKGIASITPKLYTKNGKVELGYYAQDFVGILDSAVSKGSDDMLSLSYREVLVAKVYALEQEIKELKAKLN